MNQPMFPGMDDALPLFSGTAIRTIATTAPTGNGVPDPNQSSFAECRVCRDTGRLQHDDRQLYCWCQAGVAARQADREAGTSIHEITAHTVQEAFPGTVTVRPNWVPDTDEYGSWNKMLECGRSYMVGRDVPMSTFIRSHRTRLQAWQRLAFAFCKQHPKLQLHLISPSREWSVYVRGEYVEYNLPHHDMGGENTYVSVDGRYKVHINRD